MARHTTVLLALGCLLLPALASSAVSSYLVLCGDASHAPSGIVPSSLCDNLASQSPSLPRAALNYPDGRVISLLSWQFAGPGFAHTRNGFNTQTASTLPPQVLYASVQGYVYTNVFIITTKISEGTETPSSLFQLKQAAISAVGVSLGAGDGAVPISNITITTNVGGITFRVWSQTPDGKLNLDSNLACVNFTTEAVSGAVALC